MFVRSIVRLFDTKSAPRISRKPFDLESPNFMGTSTPILSTARPDMTSLFISGRQQIAQTCKFLVTFGSRFLDNGSRDSKKVVWLKLARGILIHLTSTADLQRQIQTFENKCYRRMRGISYREHKMYEYVWQQVNIVAGRQEPVLSTVYRQASQVPFSESRREGVC